MTKQALEYCESLDLAGLNNWRLPDVNELSSLIGSESANPAIFPEFVTTTVKSGYWTATEMIYYPVNAWFISFDYGSVDGGDKDIKFHARCANGAKAGGEEEKRP